MYKFWNFNLQRTASSIAFIKKSLHYNLVPTLAKVQDQFVNNKDKTRSEESILKSNLVAHKRNMQILSGNHEDFAEQLKQEYGVILFRMLYLKILAVSQRPNLEHLKRKNNKLWILSLKVLKNRDSHQAPVINSSSQVLDTKPLKYGLHQGFTDKNKFVKRNAAVEHEGLAASLDHYVKQSDKKAFHEYLLSRASIITKNIYTDKDDTFTSLQKLRRNKEWSYYQQIRNPSQ